MNAKGRDMKATLHHSLEHDPVTPNWLVQGTATWGNAPTLKGAIANAHLSHGAPCVVMRCDAEAHCHPVSGNVTFYARSSVWKGTVFSNWDVALQKCISDTGTVVVSQRRPRPPRPTGPFGSKKWMQGTDPAEAQRQEDA